MALLSEESFSPEDRLSLLALCALSEVSDEGMVLPEDLKTAMTLRELDGLSYEEIAEVMDCPVGTVRSRIFRAREAVEKKIKPLLQR